jgi:hypothetical protein
LKDGGEQLIRWKPDRTELEKRFLSFERLHQKAPAQG